VLYDQYDSAGTTASVSQDFETVNDAYDSQLADDFVVPSGQTWTINEVDVQGLYFNGPGPADSFNVWFYQNNGTLPGTQVYQATGLAYSGNPDFVIPLTSPAVLSAGTYWVSVQARMDFTPGGEFGWYDRTAQSNSGAAWRNPGDGFATGCTDWTGKTVCIPTATGPDQVYRLMGTTGGSCGTPVTPSPTFTSGPSATPTCSAGASWSSISPIIASPGLTRAGGTYFPGDGKVYVIGGRTADDPDQGNSTIYTYDPGTDTWGTATTALTDTKVSNLAVAMLNSPSGPRIYAVGGSYPSGSADLLPTNIVRVYDPVGGSLTQADNWPQTSPLVIPGGWTVFNNKLYIFGGYDPVAVAMIPDIWEFDPMAASGSQWTHKSATLSLARSYIATQTIGNFIYLAGGFDATLVDQVTTERYDPSADTICDACMADLPAITSNAKGYTDGTLFYVPGGDFPTPEDTTRVYDPGTDTCST
jgi:hypothetical protein